GGFLHMTTTPYGPGWDVKSTGQDVAIWDSSTKAILGKKVWSFSRIGLTEHWEFKMMLPTQSLVPAFQQGVLFEFHTDDSSGHHVYLSNGQINLARQSVPAQVYARPIGATNNPYDQWKQVVIDIKWSNGSDGFLKYYYDGTLLHNFTGPTAFAGGGEPVMQWGFYANNSVAVDNRVFFGDFRY